MQSNRWLLPEGVQEMVPPESWRLEAARRQLLDLYWRWGYDLIRPPLIEYLDSLLTGAGHELDLQTFKLTDQLNGRMMGVRSDMTTQATRIDAHRLQAVGPARYCYIGSILRTRPEEPGGSRSPLQVGAEKFGDAHIDSDLEIVSLMLETLTLMGIDNACLDLGHVAIYRRLVAHADMPADLEPQLFDAAGLASSFVGHPVAEGDVDAGDGAAFRARHGIAPGAVVLCVLPGSRRGEVGRLTPVARETLDRVMPSHPGVEIVIPAAANVRDEITELVADWPWPVTVVDGATERYDAFAAADLALATSGTVTLELAWAGVPTVVMYRVPWLTGEIARRMIKVRYASIVNIIADREVLPEFLQPRCRPELIAGVLSGLLDDPERRAGLGAEARRIARELEPGGERPSERAARAVLDIVAAGRES